MKKIYFLLFLLGTFGIVSQINSQVTIKGNVIDGFENKSLANVEISILGENLKSQTDENGNFNILVNENKIYNLIFSANGYELYFGSANTKLSSDLDLGTIKLNPIVKQINETESISEELFESDDEGQRVSSMLSASNDLFERTSQFNFYVARFKSRGLGSEYGTMYLNGMPVEDLEDGYISWNLWGGLNDVMRARSSSNTLEPAYFDFGGLAGTTDIDISASAQWKQTRISFAESNRTYRHRAMITHSSGMQKNGWAYSIAASRRWAQEGYVEGTFYDAYSAFISVDKKLNEKHLLNLVALAAPNQRGGSAGAPLELYELAWDHYYNPTWGYQEGEKRNSKVYSSFQPIAILKHVWKFNKNSELSTSLGGLTGKYGKTRLDWYSAPDPRPTYYGYLGSNQDFQEVADVINRTLATDVNARQINWTELYLFNKTSSGDILKETGYTGDVSNERFSHYLLQEQREDPTRIAFNSNLQTILNKNISLNGGLSYVYQNTNYFQIAEDLLGGTYHINWDKFAERDFPDDPDKLQYDLNDPNRIIREGDRYGYDYEINTNEAQTWAKTTFSYNKFDAYLSGQFTNTSFYRNGNTKNGKFPENSFGKSETITFNDYGIKAGATLKIDGRNYIYANGLKMTKAPFARNAYISPKTRDDLVNDLKSENITSGELGYLHHSPSFYFKAVGYYININDKVKVTSFYHDEEQSFVNYILNGVDELHTGVELSTEYKFNPAFSINAIAAIGQYIYNNRPTATISIDNNAEVLTDKVVFIKNYRIPGTPQQAYSVGLKYNSPKYWFASISFNYFADSWLDFFPERRTLDAVDGVDKESQSELWYNIISQEKLPSDFTVDIFGGKSWRLKNRHYIYLNVGVNNILDNQDFITGGYEAFRFDYQGKNYSKFPSTYYYAYGANYYLSLTYRM